MRQPDRPGGDRSVPAHCCHQHEIDVDACTRPCRFGLHHAPLAIRYSSHAGPVAEGLCRGLQILLRRFESGPGLQLAACHSNVFCRATICRTWRIRNEWITTETPSRLSTPDKTAGLSGQALRAGPAGLPVQAKPAASGRRTKTPVRRTLLTLFQNFRDRLCIWIR